MPQIYHGTWEEIQAQHGNELVGKHLTVVVTEHEATPTVLQGGQGFSMESLPQLMAMARAIKNGASPEEVGFSGSVYQANSGAPTQGTFPAGFPFPAGAGFPGITPQNDQQLPNMPEVHTKKDDLPEW